MCPLLQKTHAHTHKKWASTLRNVANEAVEPPSGSRGVVKGAANH